MSFYVADTHAWVRYLLDKLPPEADRVFRSAEEGESVIFIPTMVLAECIYLVEKRKIALDYRELFSKLRVGANFSPASLTLEIIEKLPEIHLHEVHEGRRVVD